MLFKCTSCFIAHRPCNQQERNLQLLMTERLVLYKKIKNKNKKTLGENGFRFGRQGEKCKKKKTPNNNI